MSQPARIVLALVIGLAIWFAVRAHSQTATAGGMIQWGWQGGKLYEKYTGTHKLEFGLHPNGTVVWRETLSATNSPAEQISRALPLQPVWTNRNEIPPLPQ